MKSQVLGTVWCSYFWWGCRGNLKLITLGSERVNVAMFLVTLNWHWNQICKWNVKKRNLNYWEYQLARGWPAGYSESVFEVFKLGSPWYEFWNHAEGDIPWYKEPRFQPLSSSGWQIKEAGNEATRGSKLYGPESWNFATGLCKSL